MNNQVTTKQNNEEWSRYYIGTGATNAKYTLRCEFYEWGWGGKKRLVNRHVLTLTTDPEDSYQRVAKYFEEHDIDLKHLDTFEGSELRPITRDKIDHNVIRFGKKYPGLTVQEVFETDPSYLAWCVENVMSKEHAKTIAIMEELVVGLVAERETERKAKEQAKLDRERTWEEKRKSSKHVGTVKERLTLTLTYTGNYSFEGHYGYQHLHFFTDDNDNAFVWKTSTYGTVRDELGIEVERGSTVKVKGTVKKHGEYKGQNQTELARVKVIENEVSK